jgi:hypothetical protein
MKLQSKIDEYFVFIEGEREDDMLLLAGEMPKWIRYPQPPTITGLALYLGFESRQSFYDYAERKQFSYTVKRGRLKIEHEYEKSLRSQTFAGAIFALKNMGWKDRTDITTDDKPLPPPQVLTLPTDKLQQLEKLLSDATAKD